MLSLYMGIDQNKLNNETAINQILKFIETNFFEDVKVVFDKNIF